MTVADVPSEWKAANPFNNPSKEEFRKWQRQPQYNAIDLGQLDKAGSAADRRKAVLQQLPEAAASMKYTRAQAEAAAEEGADAAGSSREGQQQQGGATR